MRAWAHSLISSPSTICHSPSIDRTGNDEIRPAGTPYSPCETTPAEVQSSVPCTQSRTCSIVAFAADATEDEPRTWMISAPRFATRGMKVSSSHVGTSPTMASRAFATGSPATVACETSGNCVAEWLPQMGTRRIVSTGTASVCASCALARFSSSRVRAVNRSAGMPSAAAAADGIPAERFTALTRLDENRARAQLAQTLAVPVDTIRRVPIWGNHSATQFPDVSHATVAGEPVAKALEAIVGDVPTWLDETFIPRVAKRGAEIIQVRGSSSVASAANATIEHVRDWVHGTDDWTSAGVVSHGEYGVPAGLISSFPVRSIDGEWQIVEGLEISEWAQARIDASVAELVEEREAVRALGML